MTTTITKTQLKEHIAKLVAEQINNQQLSPAAQKALELSRQAKQNKDAQKKRAAAKNSMRGISVESIDPIEEQSSWHRNQNGELADLYKTKYRVNFGQGQVSNTFPTRKEAEYEMTFIDEPGAFIQFKDLNTGEWFNVKHLREQRIEGDKLHSDEADFFDTSELEDYQDDLNNDYLGFDDGDIGDSYRGSGDDSWDDGFMPGSYRYVQEQVNQSTTDEASRKLHTAAARINDEARETGERSRKLAKQLNNLLQGLITPLGGIRQVAMDSKSNFAVFMQNGTKYSIAELLNAVKNDTEW